jgi:hypothetical protein
MSDRTELKWTESEDGLCEARTTIGTYEVFDSGAWNFRVGNRVEAHGPHTAARDAAQADYEKRMAREGS